MAQRPLFSSSPSALASVCSVLACVACGGNVAPDGSSVGTGGSAGSVSGTGGAGASFSGGSGGVSGMGGSVGGAGGSPNAGGTGGEGACSLPWWGSSLAGVVGVTSCPAPNDPALLVYGQTEFPACQKMTGPTGSHLDGENLSCCYSFDESGCGGGGSASEACIDLWYFGDGTGQTTLPTTSVTNQLALCKVPFGPEAALTTHAERAAHLIGVWVKCGGQDSVNSALKGNGIVFRADGTFHTLQTDSSGVLAETTGCNQFGLWGFIPGYNQVNLWADAGGVSAGGAYFSDGTPRQLRLENGMGNIDYYIAVE